jgi:hypothetical protein
LGNIAKEQTIRQGATHGGTADAYAAGALGSCVS